MYSVYKSDTLLADMKGMKEMNPLSSIDLNADLGEGCGDDASMLTLISSANIACGGHAGGGDLLTETVSLAYQNQVRIGAHPSYPDKNNFGRISMAEKMSNQDITENITQQVLTILGETEKYKVGLSHIKPHGALYNDAMRSPQVAEAIITAVIELKTLTNSPALYPLMGMPGSELEKRAHKANITYIREGFADRAYKNQAELVPRREPHAVHDSIEKMLGQVKEMVLEKSVTTVYGVKETVHIDSLCIHGDTPNAVDHSRRILHYLQSCGVKIRGRKRS